MARIIGVHIAPGSGSRKLILKSQSFTAMGSLLVLFQLGFSSCVMRYASLLALACSCCCCWMLLLLLLLLLCCCFMRTSQIDGR